MAAKIIYEPKGKALEYAPLAANLYKGCSNGCTYCWVPNATYQDRDTFYNNPQPRNDVIWLLRKDAEKLAGDPRPVLLCFTCDAYQMINDEYGLARQAIEVLNANGLAVHILTKGAERATRDFDVLAKHPGNAYSVTLTFDTGSASLEWEPYASSPFARLISLQAAKDRGIKTWVSFEPVIDPEAVFRLIDRTHEYVDLYKIGKWNYDRRAKEIDWPVFREQVSVKLENLGKPFLIKKDLEEAK